MTYARSEELFGRRVPGESVVDGRSIPMLRKRTNIRCRACPGFFNSYSVVIDGKAVPPCGDIGTEGTLLGEYGSGTCLKTFLSMSATRFAFW